MEGFNPRGFLGRSIVGDIGYQGFQPLLEGYRATNGGIMFIYAIECQDGFYYIGQSSDPERRLRRHITGKGGWFTREHKPLCIVEKHYMGDITTSECLKYEDMLTASYIRRYGISKVRGGRFIQRDPKWFKRQIIRHGLT